MATPLPGPPPVDELTMTGDEAEEDTKITPAGDEDAGGARFWIVVVVDVLDEDVIVVVVVCCCLHTRPKLAVFERTPPPRRLSNGRSEETDEGDGTTTPSPAVLFTREFERACWWCNVNEPFEPTIPRPRDKPDLPVVWKPFTIPFPLQKIKVK